ncbi:MAG: hypothetical protein ABW056_02215 [Thermoanaerobaculia bacterium]
MAKKRGPERRWARGIFIALGALVLLSPVLFLVGYRIAAKRLLTGPALRAEINQKPEEIWIDWDEAASTWPGRVSVKNLRIRGSDPNVEWIVILPEATLRYSLMPLLRRNFIVTELRPVSIQFRLRQKLFPGKFTEAQAKQLPPIPGFSDPPLRKKDEKLPEPESNPFTFEVQDVATDVFDDIWVDSVRYRGPSKLRGRFRLKPGHRAQIGPASVEFGGGALEVAEKPAVTVLSGRLEATFADWDVQELTENKIFRVVTAKVDLSGPTDGVDFLDPMLQIGPKARVSGGPGHFALAGEIDRGKAAGKASITAKKGKFIRPPLSIVGDVDAKLVFSNWVLDGGSPDIGGSALKATNVFMAGAAPKTKGWWGEFDVPSGRMTPGGLTGKVVFKCSDGRPLLAFIGEGVPKWAAGILDLEGLKASAEVVFSDPRTTVRNLKATGEKILVEGDFDRRGEDSSGAFYIESGILKIAVEMKGQKTIVHPLFPRTWFDKQRAVESPAGR